MDRAPVREAWLKHYLSLKRQSNQRLTPSRWLQPVSLRARSAAPPRALMPGGRGRKRRSQWPSPCCLPWWARLSKGSRSRWARSSTGGPALDAAVVLDAGGGGRGVEAEVAAKMIGRFTLPVLRCWAGRAIVDARVRRLEKPLSGALAGGPEGRRRRLIASRTSLLVCRGARAGGNASPARAAEDIPIRRSAVDVPRVLPRLLAVPISACPFFESFRGEPVDGQATAPVQPS